jgi:hypothetical protein
MEAGFPRTVAGRATELRPASAWLLSGEYGYYVGTLAPSIATASRRAFYPLGSAGTAVSTSAGARRCNRAVRSASLGFSLGRSSGSCRKVDVLDEFRG